MDRKSHLVLNTDRLDAYLSGRIKGFNKILSVQKFSGGQSNPTFLISTESNKYVLRQKPIGPLLPSAHAIDREYRVLQALVNSDVPVAKPCLLCEDEEIIGSAFYLMSYVPGRIFWSPTLVGISPQEKSTIFDQMIRLLSVLHDINTQEIGLSDFGRPGNYYERQFDRWTRQYEMSQTEYIGAMNQLIDQLPKRLPMETHQISLIHGDYRIDNLIVDPVAPKIIAVIDWELSTLGHSVSDLAYFCMCLRMKPDQHIAGIGGLDRTEMGIPEEPEMINRYCELRGIELIDDWPVYLAFSFFRLAAICQGVLKRSLDGTASSSSATRIGNMTASLAKMAVEVLDKRI